MTMEFQYIDELKLFLQLFLLGGILSAVVMYLTEAMKKWLKAFRFCAENTWVLSIICFVISMAFGIGWKMTFAAETINLLGSVWLGLFLYLGSTGLYSKLEESDGFWGNTVQSYYKYVNTDAFFAKGITPRSTEKEQTQLTDDEPPIAKDKPVNESSIMSGPIRGKTIPLVRKDKTLYTNFVLKNPTMLVNLTNKFQRGQHNGLDEGWTDDISFKDKTGYGHNQDIICPIEGLKIVEVITDHSAVGNAIKARFENFAWNKNKTKYYDLELRFIHLEEGSITVKPKQILSLGQVMARMGATPKGKVGEHLHVDVLLNLHGTKFDWSNNWRNILSVDPVTVFYIFADHTIYDKMTSDNFNLRYSV